MARRSFLEWLRFIFGISRPRKVAVRKPKARKKIKRVKKIPKKIVRKVPKKVKIVPLKKIRKVRVRYKPRVLRIRRKKIKRLKVREVAEAFRISASAIEKIYRRLKQMEEKIPERPTAEVNVESLKGQLEHLEHTAHKNEVTLVPEVMDLIAYTKQRIREIEAIKAKEKFDPVTAIENEIEELKKEKKNIEEARKIIKTKFFRREIEESSFKSISDEYEKRLVELEVKMKALNKELETLKKEAKAAEKIEKVPLKLPKAVKLRPEKRPIITLPKFRFPKIGKPVLPVPKPAEYVEKKPPAEKVPKEVFKEIIVADAMTKSVVQVRPSDTLDYVARLFSDKKISGAPVMKGENFIGVISESDIVKFVGTKDLLEAKTLGLRRLHETKVEEIMQKNPVSIYEYAKLSDAIDLMNERDITRLPVLNEERDIVGILTRSDILRGLSKALLFHVLRRPEEIEKLKYKIETEIDEILQIVERKGSIGIDEIQKKLMIPEDKIEEWGKVLEKHNLIELFYPPIGKPSFRKKLA